MGQVSRFLRSIDGGFSHWCPGCEEMHTIWTNPDDKPCWQYNGNAEHPSFSPSVRIRCKAKVMKDGVWQGEWHRDAAGNAIDQCCHYFLTDGQLQFCGDTTHAFSGKTIPLPELPDFVKD